MVSIHSFSSLSIHLWTQIFPFRMSYVWYSHDHFFAVGALCLRTSVLVLFSSSNGLLDDTYFTIHITPEPECSFVSFETNLNTKSFTALVNQVTQTFKPGSFCLSLFVDEDSLVSDSRKGLEWNKINGYTAKATTHHVFQAGYNATCAHYEVSGGVAGSSSFGIAAATAAAAIKRAADSFDEHTALATQKLKDHLAEVTEAAKLSEANYNKVLGEKTVLEQQLAAAQEAATARENELLARIRALEQQLLTTANAASSSSPNGTTNGVMNGHGHHHHGMNGVVADENNKSAKKKRKVDEEEEKSNGEITTIMQQ